MTIHYSEDEWMDIEQDRGTYPSPDDIGENIYLETEDTVVNCPQCKQRKAALQVDTRSVFRVGVLGPDGKCDRCMYQENRVS
jgi:hypothetical protein